MRTSLLILLIFFTSLLSGQEVTGTLTNCCNHEITESNFNDYIDNFYNLTSECSNNQKLEIINRLSHFEPSEPALLWHKAMIISNIKKDTSDCRYYRECIDLNYKKGSSYFNIAASYINFLYGYNNLNLNKSLSLTDTLSIFNFAEKNLWSAAENDINGSYFEIGLIQDIRNKLLSNPAPNFDVSCDTIFIIAFIPDCGEFGGHCEKIIQSCENDNFFAKFSADSIYCMNEKARPSANSKYNGVTKQVKGHSIKDLIEKVYLFKEKDGVLSNAPFRIALVKDNRVISKIMWRNDWPHYLEFRREVFGF